jgi:hypothetical protein
MAAEMDEPVIPPLSWREQLRNGSFPLMLTILLWLLVFRSERLIGGDTWFNLVLGRQIAESGIILRDMTTATGWGTPVIDVQWLAHLIFFHIVDMVGVDGMLLTGAIWIAVCFASGGLIALRSGGTPGRVLLAMLIAIAALASTLVLRAQALVYPMLILFPAVLRNDAQRPSAGVWLLVPIAMVWANLHGSVLLAPVFTGALLVARVLDDWRFGRPGRWLLAVRDGALTLATAASVFVTPYGADVWRYYAQTAGNPIFRQYVTEWWPLWWSPDLPKIALLLVIITAIVRCWRSIDSFPILVLSGLCLMQVTSIRHATPLGLACLVLLPRLLDEALGPTLRMDFREFSPRLTTPILLLSAVTFVIGIPLRARQIIETPGMTSLEARLAIEPVRQCLLVDEQQADRLLWYYPQLIGRVSHSARVETIPTWFIERLSTTYAAPGTPEAREFLRRFPIVAIDDRRNDEVVEVLTRDAQFERVGHAGSLYVFRNRLAKALVNDPCRSPT